MVENSRKGFVKAGVISVNTHSKESFHNVIFDFVKRVWTVDWKDEFQMSQDEWFYTIMLQQVYYLMCVFVQNCLQKIRIRRRELYWLDENKDCLLNIVYLSSHWIFKERFNSFKVSCLSFFSRLLDFLFLFFRLIFRLLWFWLLVGFLCSFLSSNFSCSKCRKRSHRVYLGNFHFFFRFFFNLLNLNLFIFQIKRSFLIFL